MTFTHVIVSLHLIGQRGHSQGQASGFQAQVSHLYDRQVGLSEPQFSCHFCKIVIVLRHKFCISCRLVEASCETCVVTLLEYIEYQSLTGGSF